MRYNGHMKRGTYPRTDEFREAQASARIAAWQRTKRIDYIQAELLFRLLLERGIQNEREVGLALALLDRVLSSPDLERGRYRSLSMYREAVEAGRRIVKKTYPLHVQPPDGDGENIPAVISLLAAALI